MQRVITSTLILLALIPSLVCAMPACVDSAQAAQPESGHCIDADNTASDRVMLLADCMEVDLQKALHSAQAPQPVFDAGSEVSTAVEFWAAINAGLFTRLPIRGPPPTHRSYPNSEQPVYLSTQRLRI